MNLDNSSKSSFKIVISSFGYKYGMIEEANLVFDVRGIVNPFYIDSLKDFTGNDEVIQDFVFSNDTAIKLFNHLVECTNYYIPFYLENRNCDSITIGIGCTGGKHRSVAFVNRLKELLLKDYQVQTVHRDIDQHE